MLRWISCDVWWLHNEGEEVEVAAQIWWDLEQPEQREEVEAAIVAVMDGVVDGGGELDGEIAA